MKRTLLTIAVLVSVTLVAGARFIIEKHDATTTAVESNIEFTATGAAGVDYTDIAAIYRVPSIGFIVDFEGCEFSGRNNAAAGREVVYREDNIRFVNFSNVSLYSGVIVSRGSEVSNWESAYPGSCSAVTVITTDTSKPAGADGSEKYAVFYLCPTIATATDYHPEFKFSGREEHAIKSLEVNNIADIWQKCKIGFYSSPGFSEGDFYDIIFIGYDSNGEETGRVTFPLADFRDGKELIINEWTTVDLSPLGKVNKISLTYSASQAYHDFDRNLGTFGVCIDNISFQE